MTGTETWQFRFTVSIKPSIQLATDSVAQGGVAAVRVGQTLGQDAPAIKTNLKNVGFVKAGSGWICYLPIPWNQKPGSIDLEVSADGYTETLSLSVRAGSFSYKDYSKTSQMAAPYIGEDDAPAAVSKLFATVDDKIQWSVGGFVQPFLDSFDTPLTYGMTEYAGRSYSERGTNYGYGGRTSTNVIIRPKNGKGSMIAPASGRVLLAKDLGGLYGNTLVIEHGAGLKSIFYGLASLDVKTGDTVKQGQLIGYEGDTGNVTGTSDKLAVEGQLELIRALQPEAKTIGILYTTSEPNSVSAIAEYEEKAPAYGFTIEAVGVTAQSEVVQACDTLLARSVDCMSNLTDNNVVGVLPAILEKTNAKSIPVYGSEIEQVKKGCVASIGIDYYELGRQTGQMAAKVLKGEATCEEMPYETISEYGLYVNYTALTEMGLTLPEDYAARAIDANA